MNQTVPALPQLGDACDEPHASQHESRTSTARVGEWLYTRITWNTVLVLGIAFGAATVRFWNFQLLGYSHWDEIYFVGDARTFSANWPRVWANMHWYILPVVSETDGLLFHILGVHDWIPFAISAIYGTLSSIAIYFLGSRLFGRQVGLIAGAVMATSAYSVMYSRMALADATFDFWLIVSILFIWLGFTRRQMRFYVVGGISAGIVLNTKYDGFMPLAIAAGWLALEIGVELWGARRSHRLQLSDYRIRAIGTTVLVVAALAVFAPVL